MDENQKKGSALSPYRILDLSEGGTMIGGKILGDLGADIIKIEPPGGSPSRKAPFYQGIHLPEKSLFWFAYNTNKRGITLDINNVKGREIFKKLVLTSDAVIESFDVNYLNELGLGYNDLIKIKPDIILTSISPFGQTGPKSHYRGSDLTSWASGGYLYICGDPDRPPSWISFPQASLHAGAEAAAGTLTALWHRSNTGKGQKVDVSMQECMVACCFQTPEIWDLNKVEVRRTGQTTMMSGGRAQTNQIWKCKDGYVQLIPGGGSEPFISSMKSLVIWMSEDGMAEDWMKEMDWAEGYDASKVSQQLVDKVEGEIKKFLVTKTKKELYEEGALKRRILSGPLQTTEDIWHDQQLRFRDYWVELEHEELKNKVTYCGPFSKLNETPIVYQRRAPMIGEHNKEIYRDELGVSPDELELLQKTRII
jgi:crotonobetainyl-CoA:carnitine CoA-transferase CaiB-like acyl-CoA transferase